MNQSFSEEKFWTAIQIHLASRYGVGWDDADTMERYDAVGAAAVSALFDTWQLSRNACAQGKRAYYLSMEYLMGRVIDNNLFCAGLRIKVEQLLQRHCASLSDFEMIEDEALGNGGLGRLAACYLDSAAALGLPLDGYGLYFEFGLFRQTLSGGFQQEQADLWSQSADPWLLCRRSQAVTVQFRDFQVLGIPYDMPIIGYQGQHINTLRLWKSCPIPQEELDLSCMNAGRFEDAVNRKNQAELLTKVLYPDDSTPQGRRLRLMQEYFLCSASIQDLMRRFHQEHPGEPLANLGNWLAVQLNDTHPVLAIPELIRVLTEQEGLEFSQSIRIAQTVFSYTNHTIMAEALEQWDGELLQQVAPKIYTIIAELNRRFYQVVCGQSKEYLWGDVDILPQNRIHMARLAMAVCHHANGVAKIHTQILREQVFSRFEELTPAKLLNITNGITPRRWLCEANPQLSGLISSCLGTQDWISDLRLLKKLSHLGTPRVLACFEEIRREKKRELAALLRRRQGIHCQEAAVFDVQVKRLHEYKRQLLNALSIYAIWQRLRRGELPALPQTVFLFGAKAAPSYRRAKAIIKFICELGRAIGEDPLVRDTIQVVYLENYDVTWAQAVIPAADISEQISMAGTEASGTGNMKLMLNGAVTLGTLDGANVEIFAQAGEENSYRFGATVDQLAACDYRPWELIQQNQELREAVESLVNGAFDDGGTGMFRELYEELCRQDRYHVLDDFTSYLDKKLQAIYNASTDTPKRWANLCAAGEFSSDRAIQEYADSIWKIRPVCENSARIRVS